MESQSLGTLQSTITTSSKTGSSRSNASAGLVREEDLTKDNSASPIDLECHIQAERITKILSEAIDKTKLALCLPHFVEEFNTLSSVLNSQQLDEVIFIYEQYNQPATYSSSFVDESLNDNIKSGFLSLQNRLNPELAHLIYIVTSYPALQTKAEKIISETIAELAKNEMEQRSDTHLLRPHLEYLLALEKFKELIVDQVTLTAAEELSLGIKTRQMKSMNEKLVNSINESSAKLKHGSEEFKKLLQHKEELVENLNKQLALMHQDAQTTLRKKILDSERQMVLASRINKIKQEMLQEEEVECREGYDQQLRSHLAEEKTQRARRFKVETQLISWIQKYDLEISEKQVELDEYTGKYEDELKTVEELEEKLAEQDKDFIPLMKEREDEYHEEMTKKMTEALNQHAARVIQTAWRQVLANRVERKRLVKLTKKKAAEAAAAESAAKKAELAAKKAEAAEKKAKEKEKKAEAAALKAEQKKLDAEKKKAG